MAPPFFFLLTFPSSIALTSPQTLFRHPFTDHSSYLYAQSHVTDMPNGPSHVPILSSGRIPTRRTRIISSFLPTSLFRLYHRFLLYIHVCSSSASVSIYNIRLWCSCSWQGTFFVPLLTVHFSSPLYDSPSAPFSHYWSSISHTTPFKFILSSLDLISCDIRPWFTSLLEFRTCLFLLGFFHLWFW